MVFKTAHKSRLNFGSKRCYYQTKTNGKRIEKSKSLLLPPLISPCSNNQSYLFVLFKSKKTKKQKNKKKKKNKKKRKKSLINKQTKKKHKRSKRLAHSP
jgi:hypothetical protein